MSFVKGSTLKVRQMGAGLFKRTHFHLVLASIPGYMFIPFFLNNNIFVFVLMPFFCPGPLKVFVLIGMVSKSVSIRIDSRRCAQAAGDLKEVPKAGRCSHGLVPFGEKLRVSGILLRVDSPFFPTIVLFENRPFGFPEVF